MGRFLFGIGLLAALLGTGIWVGAAENAVCVPVAALLEQATEETVSGDMEKGAVLARQALQCWQQHRNATAAVVDHGPMDEVESLFAQMEQFALAGKEAQFAATCARLTQLVRAIGEANGLAWWSFL